MGLNTALAAAGRSLEVFTAGIQVTGQNVANANTPGYIRESLKLSTSDPYRRGNLIFGTGVDALGIQQEINQFLESRIHTANSDFQASAARETIFRQLETQLRELGDADLSTSLNDFLASINEIVNQPESAPLRLNAVQQGGQLAGDIKSLRSRVDEVRKAQTIKVESLVAEANNLINTINELNPRIARLEIGGLIPSEAGALRTQRYEALNRLSEIMPVRYQERQDGTVDVYTDSDYLILAGQAQQLETTKQPDRGQDILTVRLTETKSVLSDKGGELRGVIDGRDNILGGFVDELDKFASNLIREFNRIHASGEGLRGFESVTATQKVQDTAASLDAAGLAFDPEHGNFVIKVTNQATGITETTNIAVDLDGIGTDTSLDDLRSSLDAVDNVTATITTDGRLKIEADADYQIRFADDSSGVLGSLGINTFFSGYDSANIAINSAVADDSSLLATSRGGGPSDGRNAVALAQFIDNPVKDLGGVSLDSFYNNTVSSVAQGSASESAITDGFEGFRDSLLTQRQQLSGVSLDEEAIQLLEYQRAYQSAARIISTVDQLFTVLLSV